MPIEQIVKGTTGFLSILTKRFQIIMVLLFISTFAVMWQIFQNEWGFETKVMAASIAVLALGGITWLLATLGSKEDEELLKQRAEHAVNLQKDLNAHESFEKSLDEAYRQIRAWQNDKPPITALGYHPFRNGVKLELKETPTGVICVVLHVKGEQPETYSLYKLP